jgi:hypothetical protein
MVSSSNNPTANRLALLAKDAERTMSYLDTLAALHATTPDVDPKGDIHSALMHAAIVVYSRSFKKSERTNGEADKKADLDQLEVARDANLMGLHMRIIEVRDTMIAHSDWDKRRSIVVDKSQVEGSRFFGIVRAAGMREGWEHIDVRMFRKLAELVHKQAMNRAFDLDRR